MHEAASSDLGTQYRVIARRGSTPHGGLQNKAPATGCLRNWFVDIPERGMIGDNCARCAGSDLFDHPQDHDMELLHHNDALYHEDMPRSSARHARPEILAVFEEWLDCLQDAKSRQSAPPLAAERERGLGNLWNEAPE